MHIAKSFLIGYRYQGIDALMPTNIENMIALAAEAVCFLAEEGLTGDDALKAMGETITGLVLGGGVMHNSDKLATLMSAIAWMLLQSNERSAIVQGRYAECGLELRPFGELGAYALRIFGTYRKADA